MSDDQVLDQIQQSLDATGMWVDPALGPLLTDDQVATIRADLATAIDPVYLVVHRLDRSDSFGGDPTELITQLHDRSDQPGTYLATYFYSWPPPTDIQVADRSWGPGPDVSLASSVLTHRYDDTGGGVTDIGHYLVDLVHLAVTGTAQQAFEDEVEPTLEHYASQPTTQTGTTTAPGDGGGFPVVPVGGGAAVVVALVVGGVLLRRRPVQRAFRLPASVIANVRDAHDAQLETRAGAAVLALGEAIDAAEIGPADNRDSWQQALDHYDAAGRLLDGDPEVLDVVGALVLAGRGEAALRASKRGRAFTPPPVCYFNPLHTGVMKRTRLQGGVTVTLCPQCRTDLAADRTPDVLDVERHGHAVHYFEAGVEPWSATGYGALDPDLLGRLLRDR